VRTNGRSEPFIVDELATAAGPVPVVATRLRASERARHALSRWGYLRMRYPVAPGLYAAGAPGPESPVLVSANYKVSFDKLRERLSGIDAWILVVDTKGINVWCAAGKGTFSAAEVAHRLLASGLAGLVRRRVILPQLAAPGVAAHELARLTGFQVVFGPVRAADLPEFLRRGCQADAAMRRVGFGLRERLALTPIEIVHTWKVALPVLAILGVQRLLAGKAADWSIGTAFLPYAGAILIGVVAVPVLLPWIPGRSFAFKGWLLGFVAALAFAAAARPAAAMAAAYLAVLPAISGFLSLFFTGSSTFTSLSGVRKEMRVAVPAFAVLILAGVVLSFLA
jgi:hypothetical protein